MTKRRYDLTTTVFLDVAEFDAALGRSGLRTIAELARVLGLSRSQLFSIRGGFVPSGATQERIAAALGVNCSKLWRPIAELAARVRR